MKKRYIFLIGIIFLSIMFILFFINIEFLKIYLALFIVMVLIFIVPLFVIDVQAKPPISTIIQYNLKEEKFGGRKVFIMTSKQNAEKSDKYILYFHGGAYVMEASYKHWQFLEEIVDRTGMTLILPDYPLTPKNTYKEVFKMIYPLYKETIAKVGKEKLILMGDSAGGGMALGLLQKIGEEQGDMPYKTILLSPWLDVRMNNPEIIEKEKVDPVLLKEPLKVAGKRYAGDDGMENYLVNPILGPLDKLEKMTIYTGTYDMLNPDVHKFVERAKKEGLDIDLREKEKAIHIWMTHIENKNVYSARETFEDIINLLQEEG
jgi:acetyl esterase/lipase